MIGPRKNCTNTVFLRATHHDDVPQGLLGYYADTGTSGLAGSQGEESGYIKGRGGVRAQISFGERVLERELASVQ